MNTTQTTGRLLMCKNNRLIKSTQRLKLLFVFVFLFMIISCKEVSKESKIINSLKGSSSSIENRLDAFVDISHHNTKVNLMMAQKSGLVGFFHKATQGINFIDDKYGERVQKGRLLGLLIGAYHFGTGEAIEKQVEVFLTVIRKYGSQNIVPVLDWEDNPNAKEGTMNQKQASEFINLFFQKTGIYPMIYGGYWMLYQLRNETNVEAFSKTPLWQGFYSSTFGYLDGIWKTYSFIQYTNGTLGPNPHEFKGIGSVDREFFNGTLDEARSFWNKNALKK